MSTPFVPPAGIDGLVAILQRLRAPDGCPWDREQTHETLTRYLIEEAYEAVEAVGNKDDVHLAEELGDVLLQVVFHAQIAAEEGRFSLEDVVAGISQKMLRRHPHVFGAAVAADSQAVKDLWQVIKDKEKADAGKPRATSILDKVNRSLPALMRSQGLVKQASKTGFVWSSVDQALAKVREETDEVDRALAENDAEQVSEELGDLLLAVVGLAQFLDRDAESTLVNANAKFEARFRALERGAGGPEGLKALTPRQLLERWDAIADEGLRN